MIEAQVHRFDRADERGLSVKWTTGLHDGIASKEERFYAIRWNPGTKLLQFGKDIERMGKYLQDAAREEL